MQYLWPKMWATAVWISQLIEVSGNANYCQPPKINHFLNAQKASLLWSISKVLPSGSVEPLKSKALSTAEANAHRLLHYPRILWQSTIFLIYKLSFESKFLLQHSKCSCQAIKIRISLSLGGGNPPSTLRHDGHTRHQGQAKYYHSPSVPPGAGGRNNTSTGGEVTPIRKFLIGVTKTAF